MKIIAIECDAEELKANRGIMDAVIDACSGLLNSFYGTYTPGADKVAISSITVNRPADVPTLQDKSITIDGNKPKTQNEIAESMGISRSYVSRIETKAINKLAKEIKDEV